jgi:hypothetical protein
MPIPRHLGRHVSAAWQTWHRTPPAERGDAAYTRAKIALAADEARVLFPSCNGFAPTPVKLASARAACRAIAEALR